MYVKLFTQILDSSLADDRKLRHFFTDLLLCADPKGYVVMTPNAIARKINATEDEVLEGLKKLSEPDPCSKTPDCEGRRIEPLEGMGYGWRIVNYEAYRAMKDADQMREATKERVRRYRERKRMLTRGNTCNAAVTPGNAITEAEEEAEGILPHKDTAMAASPRVVRSNERKSVLPPANRDAEKAVLPDQLKTVDGFRPAWDAFVTMRKTKRNGGKMTPYAAQLLLNKLAGRPDDAVALLNLAIERQWTGFEWRWFDDHMASNGAEPPRRQPQQPAAVKPIRRANLD